MDRFKFLENSSTVVLPYSVDYYKIANYYIIVDAHGIYKEDYLYAKSRKMLAELVASYWGKHNYGFWVEKLVKESEPNTVDISKRLGEDLITSVEDTELLKLIYTNINLDFFVIRGFVNNKYTPSEVINSIARKVLKQDNEVEVTSYEVFQSALCKPSYTKKFITKVLPNLHISYAETLRSKGLLDPTNRLLLVNYIKEVKE